MVTTKLPNYTATFDNVIPQDVCKSLISAHTEGNQEVWDRNGAPKFTQVNINESKPDLVSQVLTYVTFTFKLYTQLFPITKYLPEPRALEEFRVKCYNSGSDDRYDTHIDVQGADTSKRYLAFLFYLNDDFSGGHTEFENGPAIVPETGRALVFPPYWMYPHAGKRVITGTKYIMSTYLHLT